MTVGFGMSIGTVNSVWAAVGDRDQPAVRVRRTAVTFDSAGGARMGTLPRFAPVVTDFADLTRYTEPVVLNGRIWTQADLVAAVIACLLAIDEPAAGPVAAYPAVYSDRRLSPLRHALERAGAADVTLMPEAVAAVEWLDAEYGVSENGLTLVYDLGGNTLDVAVVRTEGDRDKRGVLGKPMRSHEYGGRPLGTVLARYARALAPGAPPPVSQVVPLDDTTRLRTWTVRNSLRLVRKCVYAAGLTLRDIDRVLLVGGAARPPEVARVLSELGRPLVMSQDPAHTVAVGAALAAARMADPGVHLGRYARGAAVVSSAAVASAVAMSAASMLGSGPLGTDGPALEFAPALAGPPRNEFRDTRVLDGIDPDVTWSAGADGYGSALPTGFVPALSAGADGLLSMTAALRSNASAAQAMSGPYAATTAERAARGRGTHCVAADRPVATTYANPARFTNPLPFSTPTTGPVSSIPSVSLPGYPVGSPPAPPNPGAPSTHLPGGSLPDPSGTSPGTPSGTPVSDNTTTAGSALPNGSTGTHGAAPSGPGPVSPGQATPPGGNTGPGGADAGPGGVGSGTGPGDTGGGTGPGIGGGAGPGGPGGNAGRSGVGGAAGSGGVGGTGQSGVGGGAGSGGVGGGAGQSGVGGDGGSGGVGIGAGQGGVDGGAGQGGAGSGGGAGAGDFGGGGAGSGGSTGAPSGGAHGSSSQGSDGTSGSGTPGGGNPSGRGTSGNPSSGGGSPNHGATGGHSSSTGTSGGGSASTGHSGGSSPGGLSGGTNSGRTSNPASSAGTSGSRTDSKPGGSSSRGSSSGGSHGSSGGSGSRR